MDSNEENSMKLSKIERFMISNQLKILEKLYPEEASGYAEQRKAVEEGYTFNYNSMVDHIYDEMPLEDCKEVLDILQMFSTITFSYEDLEDKTGIEEQHIRFNGFDGNNEPKQMSYARYFIVDLDRYHELRYGNDYPSFNSHMRSLDNYRRMLTVWKEIADPYRLSKESIIKILEA